ncbi:hypothetical protein [Flavobacterium terrisoli]|uniref:hypothetical protein n=1 Tax=Flavobacterium terrisoli TaxID=3242195 RepID=UPI002543AC4A|nr:hypothetical protein [Flavobacterium buctense]
MSDLSSKYYELANEVFRNFIFYIPKSILDINEFKSLADDTNFVYNWLDKIVQIDNDFNWINNSSIELTTLLLKSTKLQDNCFKLIEYKVSLDGNSFNYLSEKYLKEVETYTYFSNQLSFYFQKKSPVKNTQTLALFNCQNFNFNNHLVEVEKITGLKAQNFNPQNFIQEVNETNVFKKFSVNLTPREKYFRDFISHERNKEIEKIISEKFQNEKGKKLRYLIEYFNELEIISLVHGDRTKIYSAMKNSFNWEIGTHQSIFGNWFSKPNKEYIKFKETLNSYFPFLIKV